METDYNKRRKWISRVASGLFVAGAAMISGGFYNTMNPPSQPPVLEIYEKIERELKTPLHDFTLGDLESGGVGLTARANELRNKLSEMASDQNFAGLRNDYELEKLSNQRIGVYMIGAGGGLALLSLIPSFLSRRKTHKRSCIEESII